MIKEIAIGLLTGLVSGLYSGLIVAKLARFNAAKDGVLRTIQNFGYQVSPPGRSDWKQTPALQEVAYAIAQLIKLGHTTTHPVTSLTSHILDAVQALDANQASDGIRQFNEALLSCQMKVGDLRPDWRQILGPSLTV